MDPVDQGTLVMLTLAGLMALIATVYFTVRWYRKRQSKAPKTRRPRLKKTFSRFSQVDEELQINDVSAPDPGAGWALETKTVHVFHEPTASDRDLIQSYCEPDGHETPTTAPKLHTISMEVDMKMASSLTSQSHATSHAARPSYLETDL